MPSPADQPPPIASAPLAYQDSAFLDSPDARPMRILAEYQEPLTRFRAEKIEDTIVFFGSARFKDPAASAIAPNADVLQYYNDARTLARLVAEWAANLPGERHRFVVTSGGGPGIMEAANRGAHEAGAKTIGLNIKLPFEQAPNPWITPTLNFTFHYFFMRKFWFAYLAKALVVFPGGFGTFDEMFELLTLAQTHKLEKPLTIVVYGSEYWQSIIDFDLLVERGAIAASDLALFQFADTPEEAFEILKAGLAQHIAPSAPVQTADVQALLGPDINKTRS
jgi:uncharacterized protein (TIGR00730 family)